MRVPVVDVRKVRVLVDHGLVAVPVLVRLGAGPRKIVFVLVMLVVDMPMSVRHRLMHVLVLVMLREVQPDPQAHQHGRHPERERGRFAQQHE